MSTENIFRKICTFNIYIIYLMVLIFLNWSCGSSRQTSNLEGEEINLDELLGEENTQTEGQGSEESEVLRLLGITPAETGAKQANFTSVTQESAQETTDSQLSNLKQELDSKDREINSLRTELTQKESEINRLESRVSSSSTPVKSMNTTGRYKGASSEFKSRYQYAINQFKARNYQAAISVFSQLLASDPNNSLSDNCQYWIGESYYGLLDYNRAIAEFEKVFAFQNSNKNDDAQLKLGLCYLKLGDKQQARAEFDRLLADYPDSEYVALAQRYIGRL